ncbi:universal stress protein [Dactylosporangium vinaceum]|uniref:Universal stress protein n=1 Tax=Dactylosporangium vinaceum TaxID=53362 RepID=A0ABV5MCW2_9ACTN|nr:universal stress protein [Dactylosporangium vinaceum]UAC00746.1 universal stress protein [Dactylosporangium vinaceum]
MNDIGDVIVGIDGTAADDAVVRWAAAEAARMGVRLQIVHVGGSAAGDLERAVTAARALRIGLPVTGRAVDGEPADVLVGLAARAALTVVGSHGRNALAEALQRATGTRVAMRAPGLVAVVRGRAGAADGPVVAAVSGSRHDSRVLDTAFSAAERRGCDVVAIHVLPPPTAPWGVGIPPLSTGPVRVRADLLCDLTDDVQRWHDKYPAVPAMARVPSGDPAGVLLEASAEAQLLVLGGRPHGPAAGLLAGSVGDRLLYHAACPLLFRHVAPV